MKESEYQQQQQPTKKKPMHHIQITQIKSNVKTCDVSIPIHII